MATTKQRAVTHKNIRRTKRRWSSISVRRQKTSKTSKPTVAQLRGAQAKHKKAQAARWG